MSDPDLAVSPEAENSSAIAIAGAEGAHEFIRYFIASAVALIADVGTLWLLTSVLDVPYLISGTASFVFGIVIVYALSVSWVFAHRALSNAVTEFVLFAIIGIIGLGINAAVLWVGTGLFGAYYLVSKAASVVVVFSWNFAARKWLLFRAS